MLLFNVLKLVFVTNDDLLILNCHVIWSDVMILKVINQKISTFVTSFKIIVKDFFHTTTVTHFTISTS